MAAAASSSAASSSSSSAAAPVFEQFHVGDVQRQRRLVVSRWGDYNEVHVTPLQITQDQTATATDTATPAAVPPAVSSLVALVMDVSGSMASSGLLEPLKTAWKKLAKEYLAAGLYRVVLIAWAYDVAHYELTEANLDEVFTQLANDRVIQEKRKNGTALPSDFHEEHWSGRTFPRLGFERLLQVLSQEPSPCSDLTVVFSTDGAFTQGEKDKYFGDVSGKVLSESFLTELGARVSALNMPVNMKYLGILQDHVPDAQRLMKVFPACTYSYAPTASDIGVKTQAIVDAIREEVGTSTTLQVSVDGKVSNALLVEGMFMVRTNQLEFPGLPPMQRSPNAPTAPSDLFLHRRASHGVLMRLEGLKDQYLAGQSILQAVKECDQDLLSTLTAVEKLGTGGAEKNRTRKYLYGVMRFKNELQQFAAKQLQASEVGNARLLLSKNQQLNLTLHNRYSNAVAKQITRNSDRVFEVEFAAKVEPSTTVTDATDFIVVAKVMQEQAAPGGSAKAGIKELTYRSNAVPRAIAEDETIDFITMDSFADAYASGDTRCQCVLIKKQPGEGEFHTPSQIKLEAVNAQVTLSCILSTIQRRVEVEGYASLFDKPFTGETAAQFYNAVLPTWAPNLEVNARWRLRQLLGYINGGHELAFSSHSFDIYIPAIISLWTQYFETKATKTLSDAVLLMAAFGKIKRWFRIGNQASPKAISPEQNVKLFLSGDHGAHAFPSYWEAVVHAMLTTRPVRSAAPSAQVSPMVAASTLAPDSAASAAVPVAEVAESKEQQEASAGATAVASSMLDVACTNLCTALVIPVPAKLHAVINAIRSKHDRAYPRWTPHISIKSRFVDPASFGAVLPALETALQDQAAFQVTLNTVGSFDIRDEASVHLSMSEENAEVQSLFKTVESTLAKLSSAKAKQASSSKAFHPHLTLGQCPGNKAPSWCEELRAWLDAQGGSFTFEVDHLDVLQRDPNNKDVPFRVFKTIALKKDEGEEEEKDGVEAAQAALEDLALEAAASSKHDNLDWSKFRSILMSEQLCKMAKFKGDALYAECLVPMIKEVITECDLMQVPDFTELPVFKGESDKMRQIIDGLVSKSRFELSARLLTVAPLLDAALWHHVESKYAIPSDLNARIQAALANEVTRVAVPSAPELVAWTAVANDFPSNNTRRGLTKSPRDVLLKKVQLVLNLSLDGERRRLFYKRRLDAFVHSHGWVPLVFTQSQEAWLRAIVQAPAGEGPDRFVAEFQQQFAAPLRNEQSFTKVPAEVYRERLEANLRLLWADRRNILGQQGQLLTLSVTSLPKHRCAHPLCPEFLRYNRALESDHLKDLGLDLPPADEFRIWIPSMHVRMADHIHRTKIEFVRSMMEIARRYTGEPQHAGLQAMYEAHWDMFGAGGRSN